MHDNKVTSGFIFRITILYSLLAGAWILFSDRTLSLLTSDPARLTFLQTYKGLGFVLTTALLLFLILRHEWCKLQAEIQTRQRAETGHRESEARLIEAQRLARIGDFYLDPETGFVVWSVVLYEMLGYDQNAYFDSSLMMEKIFHPDDRAAVLGWLDACLDAVQEDEIVTLEHRVLHEDGQVLFVRTVGRPLNKAGERPVVFATMQDITERRRAEEATESWKNIMQYIISHDPNAIAVLDRDLKHIFVSDRFLRDYKVKETDIIGRQHYEVFPEISGKWREVHRRALAGEVLGSDCDLFRRADGSIEYTKWECRPWYDADNTIGGIILYTEVITERKMAEEELRKSEEKFRSLFQNHAAIKLIIDPDNGNILDANKAAASFYGWPLDVLRRMNVAQINTLSKERVAEEIAIIRSQESTLREYLHRKADGNVADVEVFISKVRIGDKVYHHAIIHDITEKKQLASQLMQAQKMESIGRLAGGVAHDFNNMLGVIIGNAEMALDRVTPSEPLYDDLRDIFFAAKKSAGITRQLLTFARKQTIDPQPLDLNEAVGSMLKMLPRLIGEDIHLSWRPGPGIWPVMADPSQLDQILANLCVNARDAISGVGNVAIRTDNATFDAAYCAEHPGCTTGDFVLLEVNDDGAGIAPEDLNRIFEPFFTTKGPGSGTGLGLATVYGIVKQHKGFINVSSEPGKGTTFTICLPRLAGQAILPGQVREDTIPVGNGETVLIVEDDPSLLRLTKRILAGLNYNVMGAATPGHALSLVNEHKGEIHLLLTDVVLPEMNGRDLAARLWERHPELKVLFMSGYTSDIIARQGILKSDVHLIQKPFAKKDLAVKIQDILGARGTTIKLSDYH
jgi:PAS domain S-box-containing protein